MPGNRKISLYTAASIVIANMIGTGVFTSLGFQLEVIQSAFVIILLWVVGGILAFCGAVSYAELGAAMPRSGGEYHFLGKIYHPSIGFAAGWVSATVGFAAPVALAAMTFAAYLSEVFPSLPETWMAAILVVMVSLVHSLTVSSSSNFQKVFTTLKLLLIITFIIAAVALPDHHQSISLLPRPDDLSLIFSSGFAVSLIYVSYAYTGWNAATYIINELESPGKNLPLALGGGTFLVAVLYIALNYVFLLTAPMGELAGKIEIGYVSAQHIMGPTGSNIMAVMLAFLLISTVSAMIFAGPRVLQMMGQDISALRFMSSLNRNQIPVIAIWAQALITLFFVFTASFESILIFAGFTLGLLTLLTVCGVFIRRVKYGGDSQTYQAWGYPVTPLLFIILMTWTLIYLLIDKPVASLSGLGIFLMGCGIFFLIRRKNTE